LTNRTFPDEKKEPDETSGFSAVRARLVQAVRERVEQSK